MKLAKKGQSGQALVMALILLALGGLLVVPGLNLAMTNLKYHDMIQGETLRAYSADSGVEYALYTVYSEPESIPFQWSEVINGTTVNVNVEYMQTVGAYRIVSTATSPDNRSTTIETYVIIEIGLYGNAFACDGDLTINHSNLTSTELGACDVYANGNVKLSDATIDGDVTASGTITLIGASDISGDLFPGAEVLTFPVIDSQPHEDAAKKGGIQSENLIWTNLDQQTLGPLYIDGKVDIKHTDIILEGTVYVTGDVSIAHSNISGFGDIVAEGDITISDYSLNSDIPNVLPLLMSVNKSINIHDNIDPYGEGGTTAVLYAPSGQIYMGKVHLVGSVAADSIVTEQDSYISYPASLKGRPDLPGAGLATISYGYK